MDCKKAETFLVDYLYQELSATRIVELEKHLEVCDGCTKTLESWRAIHEGYRKSAEESQPAPYLRQRIMIAAREELERKPSFTERLFALARPALILPVAVFAILTILFYPRKEATKIAQVPAKQAVEKAAPMSVNEPQDYRQKEDLGRAVGGYADQVQADKLNSKDREEAAAKLQEYSQTDSPGRRYDEDDLSKSKNAEYQSNEGLKAGAPVPEPPPASMPSSPPQQMEALETKAEQEKKTSSVVTNTKPPVSAEIFLKQSQAMLINDDLKGSAQNSQWAIEESNKSLANQFHQDGKRWQNNGECEKAILQFNLVANNYRDYSEMGDVLLRLGNCYAEIGQTENARKTYQQLLNSKSYKPVAQQKLQELDKKMKSQEQLKALGYVSDKQ